MTGDASITPDLINMADLDEASDGDGSKCVVSDSAGHFKGARKVQKPRSRQVSQDKVNICFTEGISEAVLLARVLALYRRHEIPVSVSCSKEYQFLFMAAGAEVVSEEPSQERLGIPTRRDFSEATVELYWSYNRCMALFGRGSLPPLPEAPEELWAEVSQYKLEIPIPTLVQQSIARFVRDLPRPLILISPVSTEVGAGIPREVTIEMYRRLLDRMSGTLLIADWDGATPRFGSYRVRSLSDDWVDMDPLQVLALIREVDIVISVDGPLLHVAGLTEVPTLGVFLSPRLYPTQTCLPHACAVHIVSHDICHVFNRLTRIAYNILELPRGPSSQAGLFLADACLGLLAPSRYLGKNQKGRDLVLQQFVLDWERGLENSLSGYVDRHSSYDLLLREIVKRFPTPFIVETSTISSDESWRIDGYSTYLLAAFLQSHGGTLASVDSNEAHAKFAAGVLSELPCVDLITQLPAVYLASPTPSIDVLLLNGPNPTSKGVADDCLVQLAAAEGRLHSRSLVLFDDTPFFREQFTGRGTLAVPWLLARGWRILYSGYQTLCERNDK